MTYPKIPIQVPLPKNGMINETYTELIDKLQCTCPAGALIKASPLPSATINVGDIIADHTRILSNFTSAYGMIVVVIRMISCVIDVLCALMNPFAVVPAISRLFGSCMPDFILIFPQLAVPAIIICILKIYISMIDYMVNVIIPIIRDIVENIGDMSAAFKNGNADAQAAVAFKLVSLLKELQNIIGILSAMSALWEMIETLLRLGIGLPCRGGGGSCSGCGDDQCPSFLRNYEVSGTDGVVMVLFGDEPYEFEIRFFSASKQADFISIKDFFPRGFDYDKVKSAEEVPYVLSIYGNTYSVKEIDSGGTLDLGVVQGTYLLDGYLSNVVGGYYLPDPLDVRFGTDTPTFDTTYINKYVEIQELRNNSTYASSNNGIWKIQNVYDSYNVLFRRNSDTWDAYNISDPSPHIKWRIKPEAPAIGSTVPFTFSINHEELVRHGLIGLGCHPAIIFEKEGFENRYPEALDTTLPPIPDFEALRASAFDVLYSVAPANVDSDWISDNYGEMLGDIVDLSWVYDNYGITPDDTEGLLWALDNYNDRANLLWAGINNELEEFKGEILDYVGDIYSRTLDKENSILSAEPLTQTVGEYSTITVIPLDKSGGKIARGLPIGTIGVEVQTTIGTLSTVNEVLDEYGAPTGDFTTTLTYDNPDISTITATVDGYYISDFNGYTLDPKEIQIEFVEATYTYRGRPDEGEGSGEPLGVGHTE